MTPTPIPSPTPALCEFGADVQAEGWQYRANHARSLRSAPRFNRATLTGQRLAAGVAAGVVCLYHPDNKTDRWAGIIAPDGRVAWVVLAVDTNGDGIGELYGRVEAGEPDGLSRAKLGSHIDVFPDEARRLIAQAGGRIVTLPDRYVGEMWRYYVASGGEMTIIARASSHFPAGTDFLRLFDDLHTRDPVELAYKWYNVMKPVIDAAPPGVYWQAVNEPPTDLHTLVLLAEFERERMRIADAEGWKAAIFGFTVGLPDLERWQLLYPALEAAHQGQHLLVLNEYFPALPWVWWGPNQEEAVAGNGVLNWPHGYAEGWLFGRYRKVWREHIEPNGWTGIRIALGETGSDIVATTEPVGNYLGRAAGPYRKMQQPWERAGVWRGSLEATYLELLKWVDEQLRQDPYVLGACVFTHSDFSRDWYEKDWGSYGITGPMAHMLYAYVEAERTTSRQPAPYPGDTHPR
jgi:hypothetical protein